MIDYRDLLKKYMAENFLDREGMVAKWHLKGSRYTQDEWDALTDIAVEVEPEYASIDDLPVEGKP